MSLIFSGKTPSWSSIINVPREGTETQGRPTSATICLKKRYICACLPHKLLNEDLPVILQPHHPTAYLTRDEKMQQTWYLYRRKRVIQSNCKEQLSVRTASLIILSGRCPVFSLFHHQDSHISEAHHQHLKFANGGLLSATPDNLDCQR